MRIFAIILCLFILQIAVILMLEHRRPQRALAWLFITFCCPPAGLLFYYFLGRDYWQNRRIGKRCSPLLREIRTHVSGKIKIVKNTPDTGNPEFEGRDELLHLLSRLSESPVTGRNKCRILSSGQEAYEDMLEAMETARENIHLEFYIFRDDVTYERFKEVMIRKCRQGLKCVCYATASAAIS